MVVLEKDKTRFLFGRAGDHLLTTFQCDTCQFRNIKGRSPNTTGADELLLKFIWRATLDSFWAREPGTVNNTRREIMGIRTKAIILGMDPDVILPIMGPFPVTDKQGMGLACCLLLRTLDEGRNEDTVQFSTALKLKTSYANMWRVGTRTSGHSGQ